MGLCALTRSACCDGSGDLIYAAQHKWATVPRCRMTGSFFAHMPSLFFLFSFSGLVEKKTTAGVNNKTNKKKRTHSKFAPVCASL